MTATATTTTTFCSLTTTATMTTMMTTSKTEKCLFETSSESLFHSSKILAQPLMTSSSGLTRRCRQTCDRRSRRCVECDASLASRRRRRRHCPACSTKKCSTKAGSTFRTKAVCSLELSFRAAAASFRPLCSNFAELFSNIRTRSLDSATRRCAQDARFWRRCSSRRPASPGSRPATSRSATPDATPTATKPTPT